MGKSNTATGLNFPLSLDAFLCCTTQRRSYGIPADTGELDEGGLGISNAPDLGGGRFNTTKIIGQNGT